MGDRGVIVGLCGDIFLPLKTHYMTSCGTNFTVLCVPNITF